MSYPITTRSEQAARRSSVRLGSIWYDQSAINPTTGVRSDCSGWWWWLVCGGTYTDGPGFWLGAPSTQSAYELGMIREIPVSALQPYDAIGYCGPDTANGGGGHIAPYLSHTGDMFEVLDHGSGWGPKHRFVQWNENSTGWLAPGKCKAWRYIGVVEETHMRFVRDPKTGQIYQIDRIDPVTGKIRLLPLTDIAVWTVLKNLGYTFTDLSGMDYSRVFEVVTGADELNPGILTDVVTNAMAGGIDVRVSIAATPPDAS